MLRSRNEAGSRVRWGALLRSLPLTLLVALALTLAGCSAGGGGGGSDFSLGLAGSTLDHQSQPPTLAPNAPDATYAFVYDNQIWVHVKGKTNFTQVTKLALSNGATLVWGPLVWSPDGKYIAFSLVQNLTPSMPTRSYGPIYFVDVATGATSLTPGTGSVYGHTYDWYDDLLFYSSGGGVMMYNLAADEPRVWTVIPVIPSDGGDQYAQNGAYTAFGDLALLPVNGVQRLLYTRMSLDTIGATGEAGTAEIANVSLAPIASYKDYTSAQLPDWLATQLDAIGRTQPAQGPQLGKVYADANGDYSTGAWELAPDDSRLIYQNVAGVDVKGARVTSTFCRVGIGYGGRLNTGCTSVLGGAGAQSLATHPQLALTNGAAKVALASDALSIDGGGKASGAPGSAPPAWTPDGSHVVYTQVVRSTTDANGVTRLQTNAMLFDGSNSALFIQDARNLAFSPQQQ